uniref:Uncharacterized protein n=1 Tax=Caenorhabditis japonica TaxID=281687 RepID=A0A8R1EB83_CAEJA
MRFVEITVYSAFLCSAVIGRKDPRCFPPTHISLHPDCVQDSTRENANFDCQGAHFERTAGIELSCSSDHDCSNTGEPNEWCNSDRRGYQWTTRSCHCDLKLGACTVQRYDKRTNDVQWAYCTPRNRFRCDKSDYCSPTTNSNDYLNS